MGKGRFEAFSDGVIAIIITIMVLELKVPHGGSMEDLMPLLPVFLSYILSFVYVGIYWNNHHHMLHATHTVSSASLWANLHLLFWLSLIPFTTGWMGENHFSQIPTALYGINLFMAALAYWMLQMTLMKTSKDNHLLRKAIGSDFKGRLSLLLYASAIIVACYLPMIAQAIYVAVALIWLIPDRRIEQVLVEKPNESGAN
ncbi:DUF1211 domain-containing protein [Undibacterium sp. LX40W]|uniref:DUF1211 domain-containing protein n=1 Tax=Undibacterium nitidum TaxID=2762298 RepID=A0A923KPI8_9BURK|nr:MULTISPECIES: TMEM175 family protein [Undibacterium]MBC3881853.1 DUF1211 domain-containing protein [Undibacterium nitidum]MBC3892150.1 DUF1211 domain-containing protein [Undibacterium sp. LX40W]